MVDRLEATRRLLELAGDAPVLAGIAGPAFDLYRAGDRPENFYTWGAMGVVGGLGLGLALARPDRRVIVLDGDGSLLMNLGTLATIAAEAPPNLVHVVWDNEQYEVTGGQPTHTARGADLAAVARAAGVRRAETVRDLDTFCRTLERSLVEPGPWTIVVKTRPGRSGRAPIDALRFRFLDTEGFRRALGVAPA